MCTVSEGLFCCVCVFVEHDRGDYSIVDLKLEIVIFVILVVYAVKDFPGIAEQSSMQIVSLQLLFKNHHFLLTITIQCAQILFWSKYFAMQKCWMKLFPLMYNEEF